MPMLSSSPLRIELMDPNALTPAPWNPNQASAEDQAKLDTSILRLGVFKPCLVRTLADGTLEVLGGHWRRNSAIRLGMSEIPVINLGTVDDKRAREILLVDNGRYGHDDAGMLSALLADLGDVAELASFLPQDLATLDAITAATSIDLDTLGLADDDEMPVEKPTKSARTHEIMRFQISVEDREWVAAMIKAVMIEQKFEGSDQLTNAGDALIFILNGVRNG